MATMVAGPSLRQGDLVWGKLGKYPPWPGKIVTAPKDLKKPQGKKCFFVKFFGTEDHAWIRVEQLKPFHAYKEEMMKAAKGKRFQQAVDAVEEFLKKAKARELAKEQAKEQSSTEEKKRRNSNEEKIKKIPTSEKRKLEGKMKKASGVLKKKTISSEMKKKSLAKEIKKKLLASTIKKKVLSTDGKKKLLTSEEKKKILGKKCLPASGKKKTGTKKILTADGKKILSKKILSTKKKLLSADLKKKKIVTAEGKKKKVVTEGKKKILNASGKKKIIAADGKKMLRAEGKKMLTTDSKKKNLAVGKRILSGDGKKKIITAERKKIVAADRKKILLSTNHGSKTHLKGLEKQGPRKRGRPPKDDKDLSAPESSTIKRMMMGTLAGFKWQSPLSEPVRDDPHFHHFLLSQSEKSVSFHTSSKRFKLSDEEMGSTSIQAADSTAANGSINPTDKDVPVVERLVLCADPTNFRELLYLIGFLGLGLMGSGIVSNLLKMGHSVTVWNRTAEKCDLFIQEGARLGRTPAEVVSMCDITFSCVADPKAAKDLVLGPSGVLQGIRPGKCYVDMSTVDPDTVIEVSRVIVSRGGRFLEAPVSGNQQLSNDGMLVILAAGDRGVYEDCSSCFQAMGKASFFLGDVGNAAKMMLILSMVQGSFMATIAEGLTLAQVTGQSQQTLLDILNQGQLASIFLDQKCQNILQGNFKPDLYLKYIQKDLRLAIALGDSVNHPTPMAAAANEVANLPHLQYNGTHVSQRLFSSESFEVGQGEEDTCEGGWGAVKTCRRKRREEGTHKRKKREEVICKRKREEVICDGDWTKEGIHKLKKKGQSSCSWLQDGEGTCKRRAKKFCGRDKETFEGGPTGQESNMELLTEEQQLGVSYMREKTWEKVHEGHLRVGAQKGDLGKEMQKKELREKVSLIEEGKPCQKILQRVSLTWGENSHGELRQDICDGEQRQGETCHRDQVVTSDREQKQRMSCYIEQGHEETFNNEHKQAGTYSSNRSQNDTSEQKCKEICSAEHEPEAHVEGQEILKVQPRQMMDYERVQWQKTCEVEQGEKTYKRGQRQEICEQEPRKEAYEQTQLMCELEQTKGLCEQERVQKSCEKEQRQESDEREHSSKTSEDQLIPWTKEREQGELVGEWEQRQESCKSKPRQDQEQKEEISGKQQRDDVGKKQKVGIGEERQGAGMREQCQGSGVGEQWQGAAVKEQGQGAAIEEQWQGPSVVVQLEETSELRPSTHEIMETLENIGNEHRWKTCGREIKKTSHEGEPSQEIFEREKMQKICEMKQRLEICKKEQRLETSNRELKLPICNERDKYENQTNEPFKRPYIEEASLKSREEDCDAKKQETIAEMMLQKEITSHDTHQKQMTSEEKPQKRASWNEEGNASLEHTKKEERKEIFTEAMSETSSQKGLHRMENLFGRERRKTCKLMLRNDNICEQKRANTNFKHEVSKDAVSSEMKCRKETVCLEGVEFCKGQFPKTTSEKEWNEVGGFQLGQREQSSTCRSVHTEKKHKCEIPQKDLLCMLGQSEEGISGLEQRKGGKVYDRKQIEDEITSGYGEAQSAGDLKESKRQDGSKQFEEDNQEIMHVEANKMHGTLPLNNSSCLKAHTDMGTCQVAEVEKNDCSVALKENAIYKITQVGDNICHLKQVEKPNSEITQVEEKTCFVAGIAETSQVEVDGACQMVQEEEETCQMAQVEEEICRIAVLAKEYWHISQVTDNECIAQIDETSCEIAKVLRSRVPRVETGGVPQFETQAFKVPETEGRTVEVSQDEATTGRMPQVEAHTIRLQQAEKSSAIMSQVEAQAIMVPHVEVKVLREPQITDQKSQISRVEVQDDKETQIETVAVAQMEAQTGGMPVEDTHTGWVPEIVADSDWVPEIKAQTGRVTEVESQTVSRLPLKVLIGHLAQVKSKTGQVPRLDALTTLVPKVETQTGRVQQVKPQPGSILKIKVMGDSMPLVETGRVLQVEADNGRLAQEESRTDTVPQVQTENGRVPQVNIDTIEIVQVEAEAAKLGQTVESSEMARIAEEYWQMARAAQATCHPQTDKISCHMVEAGTVMASQVQAGHNREAGADSMAQVAKTCQMARIAEEYFQMARAAQGSHEMAHSAIDRVIVVEPEMKHAQSACTDELTPLDVESCHMLQMEEEMCQMVQVEEPCHILEVVQEESCHMVEMEDESSFHMVEVAETCHMVVEEEETRHVVHVEEETCHIVHLEEACEIVQVEEGSCQMVHLEEDICHMVEVEEENCNMHQGADDPSQVRKDHCCQMVHAEETPSHMIQLEEPCQMEQIVGGNSQIAEMQEESCQIKHVKDQTCEAARVAEETRSVIEIDHKVSQLLHEEDNSCQIIEVDAQSSELVDVVEDNCHIIQIEDHASEIIHEGDSCQIIQMGTEAGEMVPVEEGTFQVVQTLTKRPFEMVHDEEQEVTEINDLEKDNTCQMGQEVSSLPLSCVGNVPCQTYPVEEVLYQVEHVHDAPHQLFPLGDRSCQATQVGDVHCRSEQVELSAQLDEQSCNMAQMEGVAYLTAQIEGVPCQVSTVQELSRHMSQGQGVPYHLARLGELPYHMTRVEEVCCQMAQEEEVSCEMAQVEEHCCQMVQVVMRETYEIVQVEDDDNSDMIQIEERCETQPLDEQCGMEPRDEELISYGGR